MKAGIFLADGFEEVEGLTAVDLLRRAQIPVEMISVSGKKEITGARGITVLADSLFESADTKTLDMLILPGGMPGTTHLKEHAGLGELLKEAAAKEKIVAAICAAPTVLGGLGLLKGRRATCYPGCEKGLLGAETRTEAVITDGPYTTSRGVGTAITFALELIRRAKGAEIAAEIAESVVYLPEIPAK